MVVKRKGRLKLQWLANRVEHILLDTKHFQVEVWIVDIADLDSQVVR